MSRRLIFLVGLCAGAACTSVVTYPNNINYYSLVKNHVADFNDRNVDNMIGNMADDFTWLQINGDKISIEADNATDLRAGIVSYYKSVPSVRSKVAGSLVLDRFLATVEQVTWQNKDGLDRTQAALTVYEFDGTAIKTVWYFPAVKIDND